MAKEPTELDILNYPQVTTAQVDLWLNHPVTIAFMGALEFKRLDIRDAGGDGKLIDSSNADLTHANMHTALGQQDAFRQAEKPRELLAFYNLILIPEPEPDEPES